MFTKPSLTKQSSLSLIFLDAFALVLCSLLIFELRNPEVALTSSYQFLIIILVLLSINTFSITGLYKTRRGQRLDQQIVTLAFSLLIVVLIIGVFTFFSKSGESYSRLWLAFTIMSSFSVMSGYRFFLWHLSRKQHKLGQNQTRVIIIGAGHLGEFACDAMLEESWSGYKPVAFFSDSKPKTHSYNDISVQGRFNDVTGFIEKNRQEKTVIHEVWIALPLQETDKIEQIYNNLKNTAVRVFLVPDLLGFNLTTHAIEEAAGMPVIDLSATPLKHSKASLKRIEDIIISTAMLILLSPLLITVAILIKRDSKGSILFKQLRYGLDAKEIEVWKFRSMTTSDNGKTVEQATVNDPRITPIGKFIRKYSIDELPQLFNVLYGSMSLVGPRPHAVAHNEYYRDKIDGYMSRHTIRPGITGWAQVNGLRGETDTVKKMERRVRYDIEYIQKWSILFDIRILLKTITEVFRSHTAY